MSFGLNRMADDARSLLDRGRILPALELLKQARSLARVPFRKLYLTFNIAVVYWDKLGDGFGARDEFLAAADSEGNELDHDGARVMRANALENLMLSAVSFDEFDRFTRRLTAFAPEMPIVSGLPPLVDQIRDSGSPWSTALFHMAMTNYNRNNPALDRGRYGVAKSTYQILLKTRKKQRLSRDDWRMAVYEHTALAMRMATDCQILRRGKNDADSPEEFLPMLTDTIPCLEEYLAASEGDKEMRRLRNDVQSNIDRTRARWLAIRERSSRFR